MVSSPQILLMTVLEARYSRDIFRGVVAYARQHTNWQVVCDNGSRGFRARAGYAGIISLSAASRINRTARMQGVPFVRVAQHDVGEQVSWVSVDEAGVAAMAAQYLAGLGLRHFAFVGRDGWPFVPERMAHFAEAVTALGYGPAHQLVAAAYSPRRQPDTEGHLVEFLRNLPRPCGLLAANDLVGVDVVSACRHNGLRVPDDIAVLGVDDDELPCQLADVPLSSIAQPFASIGYEAARLLHQHMEHPGKPTVQMVLPPLRVVARASTDLIALGDDDVVAALRLINSNFSDPINVDWVVGQLPVARRSLYRKFKSLVGRTVLEQIHYVRFQKARELLAESDLSFDVVARRSGFVNARWMADSFRKEMGTTPSRFRKESRTRT